MRIIFAGTPLVAATVLRRLSSEHEIALVITRPDAPVGRKLELRPSEVAQVATELSVPLLKTNRFGQQELQMIRNANADRAVVVAFGALIPKAALEIVDWWNLHFSVLPSWRGATPLQHSLIFESGQGISLFELEPSLDTGPIIEALPMRHPSHKSAGELMLELAEVGAEMILRNLSKPQQPVAQQGEPSFAPKLSRNDARLDFTESASMLERRINAFNPEPMAWCRAADKDLRVLRARAVGEVDWNALSDRKLNSGEIELSNERVLVGCGQGTRLELLEVQPAGGKPMSARDWLRGYGGLSLE